MLPGGQRDLLAAQAGQWPAHGADRLRPVREAPGVRRPCPQEGSRHAHQIWQEHERERIESLIETYEARLRERDAQVESLRQELNERPVQVVEKWVDADVLESAHEFARRAYASREHAFRQLCLIHMTHQELRGERCSCGRSIADCDVVGVVEGYRALLRWERTQEEREERGLPHGLPYEYVRKLGRRTDDDDPHEFDPYTYGATGS